MLLVVAWDGADFEVVEDFVRAGDMPALAQLRRRGRAFRLRSTVPAVTFPAWTSFMTGAGPSRHGITDFAVRTPGSYRVRFVNSTYRRLPTLWGLLAGAGRKVGVYAMPATYPAETACAVQVCGFDTPLGASGGDGFCQPASLAAELKARYGSLAIEGLSQTRIDEGWHARARTRLLASIERRTTIVCDLLRERGPFDAFVVHYMESDTVSHHFWQFHDDASPWARAGASGEGGAIGDVYRALDASLARLREAAGDDATVMLLSDHGSGGSSDRAICWNRWLADRGWLAFERGAGAGVGAAVSGALRRAALGLVPASMQARLFGRFAAAASRLESRARFAGIDWSRTRAFSDELSYYPSLWLNVKGREPQGTLDAGDVDAALTDLEAEARELRDPFDGEAVVTAVHRRDELFDGPHAGLCPDLVLELRRPHGYSYCAAPSRGGAERDVIRRLSAEEKSGAKGGSSSGAHRDFGLMVVGGGRPGEFEPASAEAALPTCTMADAGVTALALAGLGATAAMDGRCVLDLGNSPAAAPPGPGLFPPGVETAYDEEEEAALAERLRALGYLS